LKTLTSPHNPLIRQTVKLAQPHYRLQSGFFLIEGEKLLQEAILNRISLERIFIATSFLRENEPFCETLEEYSRVYEVPDSLFYKLSLLSTPEGILGVARQQYISSDELQRHLESKEAFFGALSDGISDPGNLGSVIRSACAFGSAFFLILKDGIDAYHPKVVRSSMGAVFRIPLLLERIQEFFILVKERWAIPCIATSPHEGIPLPEYQFPPRCVVVFGNESHGVRKEVLQRAESLITIPMRGMESLGVGVSAGIIFYEIQRQMNRK